MNASVELRSLRDKPFELLRELERRSSQGGSGHALAAGAGEWVGIAMRIGDTLILVSRTEVREVMDNPAATRVPGARSWIRGITNVRGQLVPVIDISEFAGLGKMRVQRGGRLIVVNHPTVQAGLMVDEVMGFRRFSSEEFDPQDVGSLPGLEDFVSGSYRRGQETWPVFSLTKLIESSRFADAAA